MQLNNKKVTTFTIQRSRWARGKPKSTSPADINFLYRDNDQKMCCLGFYGEACGLSTDSMLGVAYPSNCKVIDMYEAAGGAWLNDTEGRNCTLQETIARLNDSDDRTDAQREAAISAIFAEQGITVTFED